GTDVSIGSDSRGVSTATATRRVETSGTVAAARVASVTAAHPPTTASAHASTISTAIAQAGGRSAGSGATGAVRGSSNAADSRQAEKTAPPMTSIARAWTQVNCPLNPATTASSAAGRTNGHARRDAGGPSIGATYDSTPSTNDSAATLVENASATATSGRRRCRATTQVIAMGSQCPTARSPGRPLVRASA